MTARTRAKYLWRVTWLEPGYGEGAPYPRVRHYQSRSAALACAARASEGRAEQPGLTWDYEGFPVIDPAVPGSVRPALRLPSTVPSDW